MRDTMSLVKALFLSAQMPQWGNPLSPSLGSRVSSATQAMSFRPWSKGSWAISSARGGLSRILPSASACTAQHRTVCSVVGMPQGSDLSQCTGSKLEGAPKLPPQTHSVACIMPLQWSHTWCASAIWYVKASVCSHYAETHRRKCIHHGCIHAPATGPTHAVCSVSSKFALGLSARPDNIVLNSRRPETAL